jgi:hypothetical protein
VLIENLQWVALQRPAESVAAKEEKDIYPNKSGVEYRPNAVLLIYSDKVRKEYADNGNS